VTAVFGAAFLFVLGYLGARRELTPRLFRFALGVLVVLVIQMAVGEIQYRLELPWGIVALHVALAAAVWALTVALVTMLWRPPAWLAPARG
jgi:heme A synthase